MPPKRACDFCVARKIKCSGSWPCESCRGAVKQVPCTFLRPARKRGPKGRRPASSHQQEIQPAAAHLQCDVQDVQENSCNIGPHGVPPRISKEVLASVVRLYQQHSYSVWPVVNADGLLQRLDDIEPDNKTGGPSYLAAALCAATMAQLQLPPVKDGDRTVDGAVMAQACLWMRGHENSRNEQYLEISNILVSFFLHVYYAKVNQPTKAMMFIQEAIARAQVLGLDERRTNISGLDGPLIANCELLFPLLWVSERGYALHIGLAPSYKDPLPLIHLEHGTSSDVHVQGLSELARLFLAFDCISVRRKTGVGITAPSYLTNTETKLTSLCMCVPERVSTRTADYHITREWMRTILWQEALSLGLLSSSADRAVMTFDFPSQVGRDLLQSLRWFSEADLLPLGRDQLLKCFEVANSLADTVLFTSTSGPYNRFELGPQDFLHALYQKLLPFLEQDSVLNSILRNKTAEALVMAPARLLSVGLCEIGTDLRWCIPQAAETQSVQNHGEAEKSPSGDLDGRCSLTQNDSSWLIQPIL